MVRAACSEWLCCSARSMAWSSVTRAGGVCGAAAGAACPATRCARITAKSSQGNKWPPCAGPRLHIHCFSPAGTAETPHSAFRKMKAPRESRGPNKFNSIARAPVKKSARAKELSRGRSARRGLRKNRTRGPDGILRQRHGGDRLQQGHRRRDDQLRGGLVAQMAVRTMRVIVGALVIPVADHTRRKDQQRDERQGNPENANRLPHRPLRTQPMIRNETGA